MSGNGILLFFSYICAFKILDMGNIDRGNFGSKLGLILATAGGAVGLGNVWRFPYMAGENGGAAFILVYFGCVLLLGLPCMISEFIIGRRGAANTARAYTKMADGRPWKYIGFLSVLTGYLITCYYAVVSGWCLEYIYASITHRISGDSQAIAQYFTDFSEDPIRPVFWTVVILLITHFVIIRGVKGGIEKASKIMMPTLFILLIIIVIASCMLPNAWKGVEFLFKPDFSKCNGDVFLGALGQSFYSLSIGMGCACTYASYFNKDTNLSKSALQIGVIDTVVAVLAGLMIFPAAFSVGTSPDSGPSLIFITLPNVFIQAFASFPTVGWIISIIFYILLTLAGLTSLISLHEVSTAFVYEEMNISRKKGAILITVTCAIIGAFCSLSLGATDALTFGGRNLFGWFDFITGQIFLPIAGFLTCIFLGWFIPKQILHSEFTNEGTLRGRIFKIYLFLIRFVCPIFILLVFLKQLELF